MISPILRVHSIEASLAFYTRVLGFDDGGGWPGVDGCLAYGEVYLGEARIIFSRRCLHDSLSCASELYLTLPDARPIESFYASLKAARVVEHLHQELWGDQAFTLLDPDGNRLTFAQPMRYAVQANVAARR